MIDVIGGPDRDRTDDLFHAMERPLDSFTVAERLSRLELSDSSLGNPATISPSPRTDAASMSDVENQEKRRGANASKYGTAVSLSSVSLICTHVIEAS